MAAAAAPKFSLVKTISPRKMFCRAGLRFTNAWRVVQLAGEGEVQNLEADPPIVSTETQARLDAETMLVVKPASEAEIAAIKERLASEPKDPETEIAELKAKLADYEARMMKLELAAGGGGDKGKAKDSPAKA